MENKNVIIILVVIIVILAAALGLIFSQQFAKEKSNLEIADKKINAGDSLVFVLTDDSGNPIANETINVKIMDKDGIPLDGKLTTNSKGKAKFKIDEKGNYNVECNFGGNSLFASCSILDNVTVKKATTEVVSEDQSSSSKQNSVDMSLYNEYSSAIGNYRTLEVQEGFGLLETPSGNYYVMAGDGIYNYAGRDSQGYFQLGSKAS